MTWHTHLTASGSNQDSDAEDRPLLCCPLHTTTHEHLYAVYSHYPHRHTWILFLSCSLRDVLSASNLHVYTVFCKSVCAHASSPVCFSTWSPLLAASIIVTYGHYGNKHTEFLYGQMTPLVITQRTANNSSTQNNFIALYLISSNFVIFSSCASHFIPVMTTGFVIFFK